MQSYNEILERLKQRVPDDIQKGEGSLVFNALAATAFEIEKLYVQYDFIVSQSHADTADYEHLKLIALDRGLEPYPATHCIVRYQANIVIPPGKRFNLKGFNYVVLDANRMQCEEAGSGPNGLLGVCSPIDFVPSLDRCEIVEILVPGTDLESRDAFYKRYLASFTDMSFAGNIAAYKEEIKKIQGVGGAKIYPVWNGVGTVKAVVLGADYASPSSYLMTEIRKRFDPVPGKGYGLCPIGHVFTALPVGDVTVNINTKITPGGGYTLEGLKPGVTEKIKEYFLELAKTWEDSQGLTVYVSRLEAKILDLPGVVDVSATSLNGREANLIIDADSIPVLGKLEVT